jgi:hypothetical protein
MFSFSYFGVRVKLYRDFSNDPAMQCSLDGFLVLWPLFWQRAQIADRLPRHPQTLTASRKLPESGMVGFAAGSGPEPVNTLAGFEVAKRKCRPTVSRWMSSSRAIRRWDQPCAAKVIIECCKLTLS